MSFDLDFERSLARLDEQLQGLVRRGDRLTTEQHRQIETLRTELERQTDVVYRNLTPWQRVQVSRHRQRPHTADYVKTAFDDFFELRGDRRYADDRSILAGLASLGGRTVMLIGHEKGRDTKERQECNFGCPHPEGYRKAQRLMLQAERLHMPVITLIDTQGAFPGLEDEERGQAEAIAENLMVMARLRTPIICAVIGEGGSGGALAIGVGDRLLMLRNAYYTVAAPEAAASILWRDANKAPEAAAAMKISAPDLLTYKLIDRIVEEPRGGAHQDWRAAADLLRTALVEELDTLVALPLDDLLARRDARLRNFGMFTREPALVK